MAQLLFVIVIIAASIGFFRCDGQGTNTNNAKSTEEPAIPSQWERTLAVPGQVEQAARQQVEQINEQNRKILQQY